MKNRGGVSCSGMAHGGTKEGLFPRGGGTAVGSEQRPRHWPLSPSTFIPDKLLRPHPES